MEKSSRISTGKKSNLSINQDRKSRISWSTSTKSVSFTSEVPILPKINTKEDIIQNFFEQIFEFIVEDFVYVDIDKNDTKKITEDEKIIVKDYRDLTVEDLLKSIEIKTLSDSKIRLRTSSNGQKISSSKLFKDNLTRKLSSSKRLKTSSASSGSRVRLNKSKSRSIKSSASTLSVLKEIAEKEQELEARITFTNGNIYEGTVKRKLMHGKGKFLWADGTVYEGEFRDGYPTGRGEMVLPDLSHYSGSFDHGFFHGDGFLNIVSTTMFYNGGWKYGKKHGSGWVLYEPNDWYDGEWSEDLRHGIGMRAYKSGVKYKGGWCLGLQYGHGIMIWNNNDYYKGDFIDGVPHGRGLYIWKSFPNRSFAFPIQNSYEGSWWLGKRHGQGTMTFGIISGAKMHGNWLNNFKHGAATVICGNGKIFTQDPLFETDKAVLYVASEESLHKFIPDVPVFTVAENVDVGFYIDKILEKVAVSDLEKLSSLKAYEERCVRNMLVIYLPKLEELYNKYSRLGVDNVDDNYEVNAKMLQFKPYLARIFLWQFYQDIEISQFGLSLVDCDKILADNPNSGLDSPHYPFEIIYFWQFLMAIIAIALSTAKLESIYDFSAIGGVSSFIFKQFLEEKIFKKLENLETKNMFNWMNKVPIQGMYALYTEIGEPHSARQFLRKTCLKKREKPPEKCELDQTENVKNQFYSGFNSVLSANKIFFIKQRPIEKTDLRKSWTNLYDFRRLGPRNIVKCLCEVCPLIKSEEVIVNMEYPLTFLEFYQVLLKLSFLVIEFELKIEKKPLVEEIEIISPKLRQNSSVVKSRQSSGKVTDLEKKQSKAMKKGRKKSKTKIGQK